MSRNLISFLKTSRLILLLTCSFVPLPFLYNYFLCQKLTKASIVYSCCHGYSKNFILLKNITFQFPLSLFDLIL